MPLDLRERLTRRQVDPPPIGLVKPKPSSRGHVVYDLGEERWRVRLADGAVVAYLHYEMRDGRYLKRGDGKAALRAAWFMEPAHA
jgi:hypothetical protein